MTGLNAGRHRWPKPKLREPLITPGGWLLFAPLFALLALGAIAEVLTRPHLGH